MQPWKVKHTGVYSFTRVTYSPVRVSIWILSPSSTNGGNLKLVPLFRP